MPGRQIINGEPYRYAYQGQEKDPETGKEAFQLRLWDGRIGRWLTTDPKGEFSSPYLGMGNNPIRKIDPDGGSTDCPDCSWWEKLFDYYSGFGQAKDELTNSTEQTNFTPEEIEQRNLDRLTEGIKGVKQAINDHTSVTIEGSARLSYGLQFADGIDGAKVELGFGEQLVAINAKAEFRLLDGWSFDGNVNTDRVLILRAGGSHGVGAAVEHQVTFDNIGNVVNKETIQKANILFIKEKMVFNNGLKEAKVGIGGGASFGYFLVGDTSGGVYLNVNR